MLAIIAIIVLIWRCLRWTMWWRRLKVWSAEKMRQQIIITISIVTSVTIVTIVTIVTSKLPLLFQGTLGQHCQGSGSQCPCQRWTFELPPSFVIIIIINAKHPYFVPICGEPTQKSLMIFLGSNLACCSGPFNKNIVAMTTKIIVTIINLGQAQRDKEFQSGMGFLQNPGILGFSGTRLV